MHNVFVYGTVIRGFGNHRLMNGASFLGHGTAEGTMYSLGAFPAVVRADRPGSSVSGEVYSVDGSVLETL